MKEIPNEILYGTLKLPLLPENNFCGVCCFDDYIRNIYLRENNGNNKK
jgi:hypothetical protein